MEFSSIPIIVIVCYLIGEILKVVFKKNKDLKKLIPVIVSIIGGIIGIVIYLTNKEVILNVDNIYIALGIGLVSGISATGTNQMIKKIFSKSK